MNLLAYVPKWRHLRSGSDGWECVQCGHVFGTRRSTWAHKVLARHPYVGNGRTIHVQAIEHEGTWVRFRIWHAGDEFPDPH